MNILTNNTRSTKMLTIRANAADDLETIFSAGNRRFAAILKEHSVLLTVPAMQGNDEYTVSFKADNSDFENMIKTISATAFMVVFTAAGYKPTGGNILQLEELVSDWKDTLDKETKEDVREHFNAMEQSSRTVLTEFFEGLSRKA